MQRWAATLMDSTANTSQVEFARREFEKKKKLKLEEDRKVGVAERNGTGGKGFRFDAGHERRGA